VTARSSSPPRSSLFPYTTLFRSVMLIGLVVWSCLLGAFAATAARPGPELPPLGDRLALLLAALPATAAVLLVLVLVQNAAVLLRSEEHTSELQSRFDLVCRLLLE